MSNKDKVRELFEQIVGWKREMDNLEDMIEETWLRIDELGGLELIEEVLGDDSK